MEVIKTFHKVPVLIRSYFALGFPQLGKQTRAPGNWNYLFPDSGHPRKPLKSNEREMFLLINNKFLNYYF